MAKTTSTTKAKTKNSTAKKKPVVKASTKSTKTTVKAKTTTKKTVAKSAPVKVTPKVAETAATKNSKRVSTTTPLLNRVQVLLGIAFAGLAALAGFFMNNESAQVLLGHLTKDELASKSGAVLAPAAHVLYEVEFRWLLVAMLSVAAILALLRGTRYLAKEESVVANKVAPLRWVDYAVTSVFAFTVAGLLNGLQDVVALKIGAISLVVAAYLGWVYERENAATGKPAKSVYIASMVLTVVPVLALLVTMFATWMYGMVRSPWYAYAAAAVFVLSVLITTRMQWRNKAVLNYVLLDRGYNRLAVLTKVAFAAILIAGLYK